MAIKSTRKKSSSRKPRWLLILLGLVLAGAGAIAYMLFIPNTGPAAKGEFFYIPTGSTYADVKEGLRKGGFIRDAGTFDIAAKSAGYTDMVQPGRYRIKQGMGNLTIVRLLRSGSQTPVRITINKVRTKKDFIALMTKHLEPKTEAWDTFFANPNALSIHGLDTGAALAAVMPDTYEFFWNTTPAKAYGKIADSYKKFWGDAERKAKAERLGLTPAEVMVLSSIVEEEWARKDDRGPIASVYLNRLEKGMKLQADPTSKWAYGDFTLRRITTAQTTLAHPYNTYYVSGLPPGPICTPVKSTVDAVLNAPKTNYLYFCARADRSGYHDFAATYAEHQRNASRYHQSLNTRAIH